MGGPFLDFRINQLNQGEVIRRKGKMAVTGGIGGDETLEQGLEIVRLKRLLKDVPGDLEVDSVIDMECLIQERKICC